MTVERSRINSSSSPAEAHKPINAADSGCLEGLLGDSRWDVAQRVAGSRGFAKSKFLTSFILYICEKYLLDQTDEITEQQIGEHVFRRRVGYNPGEDNIVRNYARLLRQRLEEYFTNEGAPETIHIVVPRGGYVPLFIERDKMVGESASIVTRADSIPFDSSPPPNSQAETVLRDTTLPSRPQWALKALCAVLAIALIFSVWTSAHVRSPQRRASDRFWSVFFEPSRDTLLVPADSGLVIYQDLTKKRVHLAEYVGGRYQKNTSSPLGVDPSIVNELGGRRYTSVVDLHLVSAISALPAVIGSRFKVRYAREVTLDDLKQSNVILLGSVDGNPWVELFQKDLNFQFEYGPDNSVAIRNFHPVPGEKERYQTDESDPARTTFGVIAVVPNLDGSGHVLLIEGINMAGTEAAADYLFSDSATSLLTHIYDSEGNMQPFEALLETSNIGANAPRPQIISQRIGRR